MQAINRFIFNLLAYRRQVVLPGLGTLYTKYTPASEETDGELSVPHTQLLFEPSEEPGLTLPQIIANHSGIPVKDILLQYNRWVDEVRSAATDGELTIEGVALLICQPDGTYWAQPSKELDLLLNPADRKNVQLPILPGMTARSTEPLIEKTEPNRRAAWFAVAGAILVVLLFGVYFAYTRGYFSQLKMPAIFSCSSTQDTERESLDPVLPLDSLSGTTVDSAVETVPDSLPADQQESTNETATEAKTNESQPETDSESVSNSNSDTESGAGSSDRVTRTGVDVYHIIAGVFSNRENAERFVREEKFDANRTSLILTPNGKYMVSIGRFDTKEKADTELRRIYDAMPMAWISKQKE